MRRSASLASALVGFSLLVLHAQAPAPQQAPATFRAGVEIVQMDVSVLDKDRRPVKGLTAADFTILENGQPQPIVAFDAVDIPEAETFTAPWMRDAAMDIATNGRAARRVVVIVFDDAHIPLDRSEPAMQIARDVVARLGPGDVAAVTFTESGRRQNITSDRQRLLKAIDSFVPHSSAKFKGGGSGPCAFRGKYRSSAACVIDTFVTASEALLSAPQGRKTMVYISAGAPVNFEMSDLRGGDSPLGEEVIAIQTALRNLQQANVNVYAVDPSGVTGDGIMGPRQDSLRMFSQDTGGRATLFTNTPWEAVPQIFRENSSYYILGFRSINAAANGGFRRVQVKVNRPDADVRARSGYFAPASAIANRAAPTVSPLDKAIGSSMPGGDLALSAALAPFAVPGEKNAALVIATLLGDQLSGASQTIEVATRALDADCGECRKLPSSRQVVRFSNLRDPQNPPQPEILSRLSLPSGRYEIRVAAMLDGRVGSVLAHVDVPDFRKDKLSASGLVLSSAGAVATGERGIMADVLPIVPTAMREFPPGATATAFLRLYQGGSKAMENVPVTTTILDAASKTRLDETTLLDSARFDQARSADFRVNLPIAALDSGAYLLAIEAHLGDLRVRREARFWVK